MPAQSPTLSPTLSAIVAGLRGSSSGMPASTLPTRSAPTSAALVKMPPPSRAKTEISEPPKPRPMSASTACFGGAVEDGGQQAVVAGDAQQAEAHDEQAGDRAAAERGVQRRRDAAAGRLGHAGVGAHRHVHADEAGGAGEDAADDEAERHVAVAHEDQRDGQDHADDGDDQVLAVQVGLARPPARRSEMRCISALPGDSESRARVVTARRPPRGRRTRARSTTPWSVRKSLKRESFAEEFDKGPNAARPGRAGRGV